MKKLMLFLLLFTTAIVFYSNGKVHADMVQTTDDPYTYYENYDIVDIEIRLGKTAVVTSDGKLFIWGNNSGGRLGDGAYTNRTLPVDITPNFNLEDGEKITNVSLGGSISGAITSFGKVFMWGTNYSSFVVNSLYPKDVTSIFVLNDNETIEDISFGNNHIGALTSFGRVFTWGNNSFGILGDGTENDQSIPIDITGNFNLSPDDKIVKIQFIVNRAMALTQNGQIYQWGCISAWNCEYMPDIDYTAITDITSLNMYAKPINSTGTLGLNDGEVVKDIAIGYYHNAVLTTQGRVITWGENEYGCLGGEVSTEFYNYDITSQFKLNYGESIDKISLGYAFSSALTNYGRVFMWGGNTNGQLWIGSIENQDKPLEITSNFNLSNDQKIVDIYLGQSSAIALTSDGELFTWGRNYSGELGIGSTQDRLYPTSIRLIKAEILKTGLLTMSDFASVSLGYEHSAVLSSNGRVFTWGDNEYGQIGDGTTLDRNAPTEITSQFNLDTGDTVIAISLGNYHSAALSSSGRVFTWGSNSFGQLGDGATIDRTTPTEITSYFNLNIGERIISVSAGGYHSAALTSEGRVFTWGRNLNGQLGNGDTNNYENSTPIEITKHFTLDDGEIITSISLGYSHSAALTSKGRIFFLGVFRI